MKPQALKERILVKKEFREAANFIYFCNASCATNMFDHLFP